MKTTNGAILWNGKSAFDGAEIQAIATTKTTNRKTGNMVQTWIIRRDMVPTEAVKTNCDQSICGNCPHRGTSCYVNVGQAPQSVFKASARGSYGTEVDTTGRMVRLGAYGDPAMVPVDVWTELLEAATGWTGYTHQWRWCDQDMRTMVMASCDSREDREEAKAKGWRTFRVRTADEPLMPGEIACPASDEGGNTTTCEKCGLCSGTNGKGRVDVAIIVHGFRASNFRK